MDTNKIQDVKLQNLIIDLLNGEARYYDYNGESCGGIETSRWDLYDLYGAKIMDSFMVYAAPASLRGCETGRINVTVLDRVSSQDGDHFTIQVHDDMGMIGDYPDFEITQTVNVTGIHRFIVAPSPAEMLVRIFERMDIDAGFSRHRPLHKTER